VVRIPAIALDTLLELVGGQVIQQLSEDSLTGIHPSLSAMTARTAVPVRRPVGAKTIQIEKCKRFRILFIMCWL
jgi:hypothetical protein